MKLTITKVSPGWRPDGAKPDFKPIYTLYAKDYGEPIKTQDERLAVEGVHEAEEYTTKSGKLYWRTVEAAQEAQKSEYQYKADPEKQTSIEWQSAVKAAVEVVRDWHTMYGQIGAGLEGHDVPTLGSYKTQVVQTAVTLAAVVSVRPNSTERTHPEEQKGPKLIKPESLKNTVKVPSTNVDDLPPVDLYDNQVEEVDLDSIPF